MINGWSLAEAFNLDPSPVPSPHAERGNRRQHVPSTRWRGESKWDVKTGLDRLWLIGLALYILSGYNLVPFHGDESTLTYMSRDYHDLVQARDLDRVLYRDPPRDPAAQELRILNGTVGKMAMGFAWDLAGLTVDDLNEQWVWGAPWEWNVSDGHMPGDRLLRAARLSSALMLVISAWALFGIARLVIPARSRGVCRQRDLCHDARRAAQRAARDVRGIAPVFCAAGGMGGGAVGARTGEAPSILCQNCKENESFEHGKPGFGYTADHADMTRMAADKDALSAAIRVISA